MQTYNRNLRCIKQPFQSIRKDLAMNQHKHKLFQLLASLTLCAVLPSYAATIGDIARNLTGPVSDLTHFVQVICLLTGIALLFGAFIKFRIHRQNPVEVPIGTPIMLIIVALGLIAIYFLRVVTTQ